MRPALPSDSLRAPLRFPMNLSVASALLVLVGSVLAAQAPPLPSDRASGAAAVNVEQCMEWLGTLASPEFEGRGTGQEGFKKAAEFVRDRFAELGLTPAGDQETYFQSVPWTVAKIDAAAASVTFTGADGTKVVVPGTRLEGQLGQSLTASGPAVLVVVDPAAAARSREPDPAIAKADLEGKVVLLHVQGSEEPARARGRGMMAAFRVTEQLRDKGPAAVLVLDAAAVEGGITGRSGPAAANRAQRGRRLLPTTLRFGGDDGKAVLAAAGVPDALEATGVKDLGLTATVEVAVTTEQAPVWNVVGILPGRDPELAKEYVVIGSHLDHLGRRGATVFPGADDDASGTTGVLAVATMFARNAERPARSVLFVCFCGEENGLIGSAWFADHCPVPLESIVAELQMDMIGRDEEHDGEPASANHNSLHLVGTQKISNDLHELCLARNAIAGFDLEYDEEDVFSRSDHANFARKGIPIAFFFTGFHRDYHQPSDTPDKINYPKLLRVATYVYDVAFELATQPSRPLVDPELWEKNRRAIRGVETPAAPMRTK